MTLLAGDDLKVERFFRKGNPRKRASSFDLTIGHIYDDKGREVEGPFILGPNEMVQVSSAEVFGLPSDVTAHVSYKTSLTSRGIWALTVGIVDPGWNCPISTTLFNFSKVEFPVDIGTTFLRVSFYQHASVEDGYLHRGSDEDRYARDVAASAGTRFGNKFLNVDTVAEDASAQALKGMKDSAITWLAAVAALFTVLQLVVAWGAPGNFQKPAESAELKKEIVDLRMQLHVLEGRLDRAANERTTKSQASRDEDPSQVQGGNKMPKVPPVPDK